ncbi:hypothetical protein ACOSP7_012678 [Xanthoceras sorbifolium]
MAGNESFVFTAQSEEVNMGGEQDLRGGVNPLEKSHNSSMKRARPNQGVEERDKPSRMNFKSILMNMSNPQHWEGLGCEKKEDKLKFEKGDITIIQGPEGPEMELFKELQKKLCKPWANALILKSMGRHHTLNFLQAKLKQKWRLVGNWQLIDLEEGFFVARF